MAYFIVFCKIFGKVHILSIHLGAISYLKSYYMILLNVYFCRKKYFSVAEKNKFCCKITSSAQNLKCEKAREASILF